MIPVAPVDLKPNANLKPALSQCDPQISVIREVGGRPDTPDAKPDAGLARGC